jgi:hypothetical protein
LRADALEILAASAAEAGDFKSAQLWQQLALDLLSEELQESGRERLQLFRERRPYREE